MRVSVGRLHVQQPSNRPARASSVRYEQGNTTELATDAKLISSLLTERYPIV
jgi:hypothetical protein